MEDKFYTFIDFTRNQNNILTPCEEDYLEMIYRIYIKTSLPIRVNELAKKLNVKPPSVNKMVKKLSIKGMVDFEKYKHISLSTKGMEIAKHLIYRHTVIENFLKVLNVKSNLTYETEKIEHTICDEVLDKINLLTIFLNENENYLNSFYDFSKKY